MRFAVIFALVLAASPAAAGECYYSNQTGQKLDWRGGDTITFDPLYADAVTCRLTPIPDTNSFSADCGAYKDTLVTGASTREATVADILVWGGIFFWIQCEKDHA